MQLRLIAILLFTFFITESFAQTSDSISLFKQKVLTGYFICIRDSIEKVDSDVTPSRYDFTIFFVKNINDSLLQSFNSIKLSTPGYTLISGGISYAIGDRLRHRQYINHLIQTNQFDKAHSYQIFNFDKIDRILIESSKSFVSVFKGELSVVGPFLPYIKLQDLAKQDLYMYMPLDKNKMEYVFSVVY